MSVSKQLTAIIKKKLALPAKTGIFHDIRKKHRIPLKNIILSFCFTAILGYKSLLRFDGASRTHAVRKLFAPRKDHWEMVVSDSTMQRVARWLPESEAEGFLKSNYGSFQSQGEIKIKLAPNGKPRRIGVMDGSCMGGHYVCALAIVGEHITYPWVIKSCAGRGHELTTAKAIIKALPDGADKRPCDLLLYDFLA